MKVLVTGAVGFIGSNSASGARHDIGAARHPSGYQPDVNMVSGVKEYIDWAKTEAAVPV
jgi:nucleoside-diphosphate-sugar epimerase